MGTVFKLIIEDDEGKTTVVPLNREQVSIGRMEGNTIRLMERNVSRRHARLSRQNGAVYIDDLNSFNGVKINGERIDKRLEIKEGDLVEIGDYHLALQSEEAEDGLESQIAASHPPPTATTPMRANAPPNAQTVQQPITGQPHPAAISEDLLPTANLRGGETVPDVRKNGDAGAAEASAEAKKTPASASADTLTMEQKLSSQPLVGPPPRNSSLPPFPKPAGMNSPGGISAPTVPDTSLDAISRDDVGPAQTEQINVGPSVRTDYPRIVCVSTEYAGREFALNRPEVIIGRVEDNDVIIEHRSVSRNHAKIVLKNGIHKIVDLESANGILVNGEEYAITDLRKGDLIELGHVKFRYVPADGAFAPTDEESMAMLEAGVTPPGGDMDPVRASASTLPTQVDSAMTPMSASDPSNAQTVTDTPLSALQAAYSEPVVGPATSTPNHSMPTEPPSMDLPKLRPDSETLKNPVPNYDTSTTRPAASRQAAAAGYQYADTAINDFEDDITREHAGRSKMIGAVAVVLFLLGFLIFIAAKLIGGGGDPDQEILRLYNNRQWAEVESYFLDHSADFEDRQKAYALSKDAAQRRETLEAAENAPPPEPEPAPEPPAPDPGSAAPPIEPEPDQPDPEPEATAAVEKAKREPTPAPRLKKRPSRASKRSNARDSAQSLEREGVREMLQGNARAAEKLFKRCLKVAEYPPCHRQLGILYATQDETAKSIRHYKRYVDLAPNAPDAKQVRRYLSDK